MLPKRRQGCIMFMLIFLFSNVSGTSFGADIHTKNPLSDFAKFVQSKETKQACVCNAGQHQMLLSLANTGTEVMVIIPNELLDTIADFQEEADLWMDANVAPFLPATKITRILVGNDIVTTAPGNALLLVPAMRNLHSALLTAGLARRVKVSTPLSGAAFAREWSTVIEPLLHFLEATSSPFLLTSHPSEVIDATVEAAYNAMQTLNFSSIPVILTGSEGLGHGATLVYHSYVHDHADEGKRRSLATGSSTGTFCVALQNADPTALQAGLNWACGQGHADCTAIQPGGPCYKQNNLAALASYAYNDYYHRMASTGATCSFNGTATTTTSDPSSGQCVFAGSTMAGGSNGSITPTASPPTDLSPPTGVSPPTDFSPPTGVSPPTGFGPPTGFSPPTGFGPPTGLSPPPGFGGSGTFGGSPSSALNPLNSGCDALSRARWVLCLPLLLPFLY